MDDNDLIMEMKLMAEVAELAKKPKLMTEITKMKEQIDSEHAKTLSQNLNFKCPRCTRTRRQNGE